MGEEYKRLLEENRKELTDSIDLKHGLWDVMRTKGLVDVRTQHEIQSHPDQYEQVGLLLDLLLKRDDDAFNLFCTCLKKASMGHIVRNCLTLGHGSSGNDSTAKDESEVSASMKRKMEHIEEKAPKKMKQDHVKEEAQNEDLNDNRHEVIVKPCSKQHYEDKRGESYEMNAKGIGEALIINVKQVIGQQQRDGTDIDRDKLADLWKELGFGVVKVFNDQDGLKAEEILEKVKTFVAAVPRSAQACIICILSHGSEGVILGTDGKQLETRAIESCLNESEAPHLAGKPKLLFYQACRGGDVAPGVDVPDQVQRVAIGSDMVIGYPTAQGYMAWRNATKGSWYMAAVVQVFMEHACTTDVLNLLTKVNARVSQMESKTNKAETSGMMQSPGTYNSLRKQLHFFPGMYE